MVWADASRRMGVNNGKFKTEDEIKMLLKCLPCIKEVDVSPSELDKNKNDLPVNRLNNKKYYYI